MNKEYILEAMQEHEISDFRKKLFEGEVKFKFTKVSTGEERIARGTLNPELMTKLSDEDKERFKKPELKKSQTIRDPHQVSFYDLDAQEKVKAGEGRKCWRSFKIEQFVEIIED